MGDTIVVETPVSTVLTIGTVGPQGPAGDFVVNFRLVTAPETLTAKGKVAASTATGPLTLTLPANPRNGDVIDFYDYASTFDTNPLTLARNGSLIEGVPENLICNVEGAYFSLVYSGADRGWQVLPSFGSAGGSGSGGAVTSVNGNIGAVTINVPSASSTTPAALGTAAVGSASTFARADHVHAMPTASDVGADSAVDFRSATLSSASTQTVSANRNVYLNYTLGGSNFTTSVVLPRRTTDSAQPNDRVSILVSGATVDRPVQVRAYSWLSFLTPPAYSSDTGVIFQIVRNGRFDFLLRDYDWSFAGATPITEFADNELAVYDDARPASKARFSANGLPSNTTTTFTLPSVGGVLGLDYQTVTENFTPVAGGKYILKTGGGITATDPSTGSSGDTWEFIVMAGSITVGGFTYGANALPVIRRNIGYMNSWETVGRTVFLPSPPNSKTSEGNVGQMAYDGTSLYVCVAQNAWRRVTVAAW